MDPNETLRRICAAVDRETFAEACEDLATWLDKGGFRPTNLAEARYMPGSGTRWSLMSPLNGQFPQWTLVRWNPAGMVNAQWTLEA